MYFLIENNSQKIFQFKNLKELKRFARDNSLEIKKSPIYENWYYTESFVILPLESD